MYEGYSKLHILKRLKNNAQNTKDKEINIRQKQIQIINEIKKIDTILSSKNINIFFGYFFTNSHNEKLSESLFQLANKKYKYISYGFQIFNDEEKDKKIKRYQSNIRLDIIQKRKQQFAKIKNKEIFIREKARQLYNLQGSTQSPRLKYNLSVHNKKQTYTNRNYSISSSYTNNNTPKKQRFKTQFSSAKKTSVQMTPIQQIKKVIQLKQIQDLINRMGPKLVSTWLPPKSHPSLYGIFMPLLARSQIQTKCRLRRYCFLKRGLGNKLFDNILDYLSQKFEVQIKTLQIIVSKHIYYNIFKDLNWKVESWQGPDKLLITYLKQNK